jgi:uncharacterized protein YndB with AHSA1/START domain
MEEIGALTIAPSGDRELVMTRVFDAPRDLVWEAWTRPELLQRWLGVRGGWTLPVCEMDIRVGGKYRWVWRGADGQEMGVSGEFREVVPPERIVATEQFDEAWYEGEGLVTTEFAEHDGRTTATITLTYVSQEVRDMVIDSPMKGGVAESYDALAEVLASEMARKG